MSEYNLDELKNIDISVVDANELVDVTTVEINSGLTPKARMLDFIKKVKNPYCFKIGEYVVKSTFDDSSNLSINDCVKTLLSI